jgi:uncharacterized protein
MLSFDLSTLEAKAAQVDGLLPAIDPVWEENDPRPAGGVRVTGRLSSAGSGRFYFSGRIAGDVESSCRRCLTDVKAPVTDDVHLIFVEAGEEEIDDPDVYVIDARARELDLRPAVREHWLLAAPAFVLCREDCKGLCPTCGADLNAGPCDCVPANDPRWDALRTARPDPDSP